MSTGVADRSSLSLESRRNLALLTVCQAVGQSSNVIMLSVTALSVITFFPYRELATLPATLQHLGVMLSVFPAAAIMMRRGRGFGFRVGSVFGMTGAGLCGLGLHASNFLLMCVGGLLLGYAVAALQMYRFAAVELVGQRVDDGHEGQRATQQRQLPGIDLAGTVLEDASGRWQPGDAVILHTGWGKLWGKENARYIKVNPGLGVAGAEWLAKQSPMLVGADTPNICKPLCNTCAQAATSARRASRTGSSSTRMRSAS
mgnify:CR=1 FL=1